MANEVWEEIYDRLAALVHSHSTTLIFVNTRRLAERAAKNLAERIGDRVDGLGCRRRADHGVRRAAAVRGVGRLPAQRGEVPEVWLGESRTPVVHVSGRTAVLIVDVQEGAVDRGPYRVDEVLENIGLLADAARRASVDVVYVQHDGAPGDPEEPFTPGWEICGRIAPGPGERVVRKRHNSAFRGTALHDELTAAGVTTLVVTGIQTEYCVDTTCRVAFELGYDVVMPELTNTTFDNGELSASSIHRLFNERIFAGRFARVVSMSEALDLVAGAGKGSSDAT